MTDAGLSSPALARRVSVGRIVSLTLGLLRGSLRRTPSIWVAVVLLFSATDVAHALVKGSGSTPSGAELAVLAIRVILNLVFDVAIYRALLGRAARLWVPDLDFWRFLATTLVLVVLLLVPVKLSQRYLHGVIVGAIADAHTAQTVWLVASAAVYVAYGLVLLRAFALWLPALAIGDRDVTFVKAWRRMRGATLSLVGAWFVLLLPLFLAHYGLSRWIEGMPQRSAETLVLTAAGGILSALLTLGIVSVMCAAYRLTEMRA